MKSGGSPVPRIDMRSQVNDTYALFLVQAAISIETGATSMNHRVSQEKRLSVMARLSIFLYFWLLLDSQEQR
jgi:hypothetical protein